MSERQFAVISDVGCVRSRNEDRWFADDQSQLFIVSDGMGGRAAGDVASEIVVEILPGRLERILHEGADLRQAIVAKQITDAISKLSTDIRNECARQPSLCGMGATVILAVVRSDNALIAHLGDSRGYVLRDRVLLPVTRDHTVVQALVNAGEVADYEVANHPGANQLTRFVGMDGPTRPEACVVDFGRPDRLLLCTDGLSGLVPHEEIQDILWQTQAPVDACERLVDAAKQHGGPDNITALIVDGM